MLFSFQPVCGYAKKVIYENDQCMYRFLVTASHIYTSFHQNVMTKEVLDVIINTLRRTDNILRIQILELFSKDNT